MISETVLREQLPSALAGVDLPFLGAAEPRQGTRHLSAPQPRHAQSHVRCRRRLILITTDRLSAFDRILGLVPYKGQVLTQLVRLLV